jgi:1,4-alpha-glucan branching enzyme
MWGHPGKKLLFMGGEIAQPTEWSHDGGISWHLLDAEDHKGVQHYVRDLNTAYRNYPALHREDAEPSGFRWVVGDDFANSVYAFLRLAGEEAVPVLVICNMTPTPLHDYRIGVPRSGYWREAVNSDAAPYGGSNVGNSGGAQTGAVPAHGEAQSLTLSLPPLGTLMLAFEPTDDPR